MLKTMLLAAGLSLAAQAAAASPPIPLKMALGSDSITVKGVLSAKTDCCTYTFKAAAGQTLYVTETGAGHVLVAFPNGDAAGPYPGEWTEKLQQTGTYTVEVNSNPKFPPDTGPFTLTLRIPPK
jgi:hypothetical protein